MSLRKKIKTELVHNVVVMDNGNWIYQMLKCRCHVTAAIGFIKCSNVAVHDNNNCTLNGKMSLSMTAVIGTLKTKLSQQLGFFPVLPRAVTEPSYSRDARRSTR